MLINSFYSSAGPNLGSLFYAACIWVSAMMIVLYHRTGIQITGTLIAITGFAIMILEARFYLAISLFAIGILVHSCGRILVNLRRRQ